MEYIGRALLVFESCWVAFWLVCLVLFQTADSSYVLLRNAFSITAFHAVNPAAIYNATRRQRAGAPFLWISLFIILFAVITDLNSLLEVVLHVSAVPMPSHLYNSLLALVIIGLALSSLALVWLLSIYAWQRVHDKRVKKVVYDSFMEKRLKL